jgi:hypothetical protein
MSSSIAEQKAYVESLDRKAVEDGLRNGHPIIAQFLFADRAKRMQQNDAAIEALEKAAGIPEEGQDIATKLADYLARGGDQPGGQPGGQMPGMPGQGPGQPMPSPGVPQVPGGAGGPMPGSPRMPQGGAMAAGMPMNAAGGGLVPRYQQGGSFGDQYEEDFMGNLNTGYEDFQRRQEAGEVPEVLGSSGILGMLGPGGIRKGGQYLLDLARRKPTSTGTALIPYVPKEVTTVGQRLPEIVRRHLPSIFKPKGGALTPYTGPAGGAGGAGATSGIKGLWNKIPNWLKGTALTAGGVGTALAFLGGDDEVDSGIMTDLLETSMRNAPKPGSAYQSVRDQIEQFQIDASTPNANELAREKILRDQASKYDKRIAELEGLQPTDEQVGLSREADLWKSVSDVFAGRSTGEDSRFSMIGDSIKAEDQRRKTEEELFLEKVATMEDAQAGIQAGLEGELAQRLRAGEAYNQAILSTLEKDIAYDQAQKEQDVYSPQMINQVMDWLETAQMRPDEYDPILVEQVKDKLMRSMLGGVGGGTTDADLMRLLTGAGQDEPGFWSNMGAATALGLGGAGATGVASKLLAGKFYNPKAMALMGLLAGSGSALEGIKSLGDPDKMIG